jgi:hypothetical protein
MLLFLQPLAVFALLILAVVELAQTTTAQAGIKDERITLVGTST